MTAGPAFIVNPAARGARRATRLITTGRAAGRIHVTEGRGHAIELAAETAARGADPVVAVGGDGTVNEVVNGLMRVGDEDGRGRPRLAVIRVGTGNDFARSVGIPRNPERALALVLGRSAARERAIDVARANERWFVGVAGAGFDARVAEAAGDAPAWLRIGPMAFVWHTLRAVVGNRNVELAVTLETPHGMRTVTQRSLLVAIANCRYSGGGMQLVPRARPDDGLLDVCLIGDATRAEVVRMLPTVFWGGHVRHPKVEIVSATAIRIDGPGLVRAQADGESIGALPIEIGLVPRALRVLTAA